MVQTRSKRKRRDENERQENLVTAAIQEFCKDSGRLSHRLTDEEIKNETLTNHVEAKCREHHNHSIRSIF